MHRFFRRKFWQRNLALLFSQAGRRRFSVKIERLLWPRIVAPASAYRRIVARRTHLIAVVGSLGKTTTTRALFAALGHSRRRIPEDNAFTSVALAALCIRPWQRRAAIEVGIGMPGQMSIYREMLRPDVVVVTSIASDHNISLPTLEATRSEKAEMLRGLSPRGIAVLNGDDPHVMWMRETTKARIVTFGFGETNDVRASDVVYDWPRGMCFQLHARGTATTVRTRLIGQRAIYPILATVAVALEEGLELSPVVASLEGLLPARERLQPIVAPSGAIILRDEFKSGLETIDAALDVMEQIQARRKIIVLGDVEQCPGNKRTTYRRLGDRVGRIAQRAIFFGDDCQGYAAAAFRAGLPREAIVKADGDMDKVLAAIPADLGEGDVVLIKGRGRQRLARIALTLLGRTVRCRVAPCPFSDAVACDRCEMLERGWTSKDHLVLTR